MFCLSKGLGVPIGAILSGSKEFIQKAKKYRQMLGGVMRQAGILAASGIVALETKVDRLKEDQENAWILAEGLNKIKGIEVDLETVQTNMVRYSVSGLGLTTREYIALLLAEGVKASESGAYIRMVTHYGITREDIEYAIEAIHEVAKNR